MADLMLPDQVSVPARTVLRLLASIIHDPNAIRTESDEAPGGSHYVETTFRTTVLGTRYTLKLMVRSTSCLFYLYRLQETGMRWRIDGKVLRNAPFLRTGAIEHLRDEDITFSPAIEGHLVQPDLALLVVALG